MSCPGRCSGNNWTWHHGLVEKMVISQRLGLMILQVFSQLKDSVHCLGFRPYTKMEMRNTLCTLFISVNTASVAGGEHNHRTGLTVQLLATFIFSRKK